jgi:hypothetical protein
MFSKVYKALYYQAWFRQTCLMNHWQTMRNNPDWWNEKQNALDRIFGIPPKRSWLASRRKGLI